VLQRVCGTDFLSIARHLHLKILTNYENVLFIIVIVARL
jgi:hypothetical protein